MKKRFILVADGLKYEVPATILVGSLRSLHPAADAEIHVYCPASKGSDFTQPFTDALAHFEADLVLMPDAVSPFARPYPHGNKLLAAAQSGDGCQTAFFDTDMIAVESVLPAFSKDCVGVVPEGVPSWGGDENWKKIYDHFDLPVPDERVRLCRGRQREVLPYFNAGFVSWPKGRDFAKLWLETAAEIDTNVDIPEKRPCLDQIALPIAIYRAGLAFENLPERYNYSLYRRKFPLSDPISISHYHLPAIVRGEINSLTAYKRTIQAMPSHMANDFRERSIHFVMPVRAKRREGFTPLIDLDA